MTFRLSRRRLLRGVGAAIAVPTLEAMLNGSGLAFADGTPPPRRFVTWFFGNGVRLDEQLTRIADTDSAHELAITLYRKYLNLFHIAIGK